MKTTLSTSQAVNLLLSDTNANWSPAGARALIEYLEDIESYEGVELELDVVAIRCEYSEFEIRWPVSSGGCAAVLHLRPRDAGLCCTKTSDPPV